MNEIILNSLRAILWELGIMTAVFLSKNYDLHKFSFGMFAFFALAFVLAKYAIYGTI